MRVLTATAIGLMLGCSTALAQSGEARIVLDGDGSVARSFGSPIDELRAERRRQGGEGNRDFFQSRSENTYEGARAIQIDRIDATIVQGSVIPGVLETAIQSDLPGMVRAVISKDVWSFDGRRVLLPAGSRLVGEYSSAVIRGQSRVFVIWTRAVRPDGLSIDIDSFGTDPLGRAGLRGRIDRHLIERFGSAAVLTLIGGAGELLAGLAGSVGDDDDGVQVTIEAGADAAEGISDNVNDVVETALEDTIDIPPTIHVVQGTRINVFTTRDLDFSDFYADPVEEEIDRILYGSTQPVFK